MNYNRNGGQFIYLSSGIRASAAVRVQPSSRAAGNSECMQYGG